MVINTIEPRSFWARIPDEDPRKKQIAAELIKREDIDTEEDIWGRAVPIDLHGRNRR